jgi:hypothetical protein
VAKKESALRMESVGTLPFMVRPKATQMLSTHPIASIANNPSAVTGL